MLAKAPFRSLRSKRGKVNKVWFFKECGVWLVGVLRSLQGRGVWEEFKSGSLVVAVDENVFGSILKINIGISPQKGRRTGIQLPGANQGERWRS